MSYEIGKVITDDLKMDYIKFGSGSRVMVILPGLSVQSVIPSASVIEKQYEVFKKDFTVYLFDRKDNLVKGYSINNLADDTASAMRELGLKNVYLYGVSMGGMVAMTIAGAYPALVSKLAIASSSCTLDEKSISVFKEWISSAENGEKEKLYMSFGKYLYSPEVFDKYKPALKMISATVTENELERFIILAKAAEKLDLKDKLRLIKCPVFAIGDKSDKIFGSSGVTAIEEELEFNPDFESYLYNGFGHAVYDTAPDFQNRLYRFFIKQ